MRWIFLATLLHIAGMSSAQSDNEIRQYFNFEDGIYLSHESLLRNTPDIRLTSNEKRIYSNPLKILRVNPADFGLKEDEPILFVVEQGLPFYRSEKCCPETQVYVGLTIVGRLSVVSYDSEEIVDIPMTAYNPYNNKPFLTGSVKRERRITVTNLIDLETGSTFSKDDPALLEKIGVSKPFANLDSLIEAVSRYNSEHKLYIKQ